MQKNEIFCNKINNKMTWLTEARKIKNNFVLTQLVPMLEAQWIYYYLDLTPDYYVL